MNNLEWWKCCFFLGKEFGFRVIVKVQIKES
jgi:hypothetical protein